MEVWPDTEMILRTVSKLISVGSYELTERLFHPCNRITIRAISPSKIERMWVSLLPYLTTATTLDGLFHSSATTKKLPSVIHIFTIISRYLCDVCRLSIPSEKQKFVCFPLVIQSFLVSVCAWVLALSFGERSLSNYCVIYGVSVGSGPVFSVTGFMLYLIFLKKLLYNYSVYIIIFTRYFPCLSIIRNSQNLRNKWKNWNGGKWVASKPVVSNLQVISNLSSNFGRRVCVECV